MSYQPYSQMAPRPALSRLHVVPRESSLSVLAFLSIENHRYYPVRALTEPIQVSLPPQALISYSPLPHLPPQP